MQVEWGQVEWGDRVSAPHLSLLQISLTLQKKKQGE